MVEKITKKNKYKCKKLISLYIVLQVKSYVKNRKNHLELSRPYISYITHMTLHMNTTTKLFQICMLLIRMLVYSYT